MASNSSHQRRTSTTDEVISAVLADDYGDEYLEILSESEVDETSGDKETNALVMTDTNATNGRGQQNRRGPRTRGGISSVLLRQKF